eukprot:TRINITY_DN2820_c0_g1_i2.p1 TRINITY_DN2820_c0_g1~~TRINITY_DN2820_c0_g1_i2.p1  ORF type:complete len:164 (-),score=36.19 TRINITY_DN2820_c0_g1_i2:215-706(-)
MAAEKEKLSVRDLYGALGEERIKALAARFYDHVWDDEEEPWFSNMFRESNTKELATILLTSYMVQKFGGDRYYGGMVMDSKHIKEIHKAFPITRRGADRWLYHMRNTVEEVDLGEDRELVLAALFKWLDSFAKSVINMTGPKADEYHAQLHARTEGLDIPERR